METYDFAVIGGGMMGGPCARHLAEAGHRVALIAAPEPAPAGDGDTDGPWGSHFDAARITRRLATDADWSRLADRSIARYRDIERRTGERIHAAVGAVMAGHVHGPMADETRAWIEVARGLADHVALLGGKDLDGMGWHLPRGVLVARERRGAGWIAPRAMRRAQAKLAVAAGATLHEGAAVARDGGTVVLASGTRLSAGHVVVATGPHAASDGLLPARPKMTVWARTVAFVRLELAEARRLAKLPALLWTPDETWDHPLYALPPVRYPDGQYWLKVGGQRDGPVIEDATAMRDWFRGPGEAAVGARLLDALRAVLPGLAEAETATGPCAVVWTETGRPYVDAAGPGVTVLAGGNGAAAKCGDEIGRLGALVASGAGLAGEGYARGFEAVWA